MKAKYTATPWKIHIASTTRHGYDIESAMGDLIVYNLQNKANAEFIVRACNAYEELLAVLKGARLAITDPNRGPSGNVGVLDIIDRTIAKAEGSE